MDQLSIDRFDVEHIAPKEQMRKLIDACSGEGLPISCISNLCYLPEFVNRSKGAKSFYQDKKYLQKINLLEVESKYSFTEREDLEWMDMPYENPEDFSVIKEYYTDFCTKRFEKIKRLFFESLEIEFDSSIEETDVAKQVIVGSNNYSNDNKKIKFADKCILRLAEIKGEDLIKVGRSTYTSKDGQSGYVVCTSKMYTQGNREKYWFAYRRNPFDMIKECKNKYILYGCKDENTLLTIPVDLIEENINRLNASYDEEENVSHWHIVLFKPKSGNMTLMLSRPQIEELDIEQYRV